MFRNRGHQQFLLKSINSAFSTEIVEAKADCHEEAYWWFADKSFHICACLLMSSLFLLWWVFFSAFSGESGITGTRSSKWKTTAGRDSHGTGGSHAEWPSPHCSGELYHSPADCPTQSKCNITSPIGCITVTLVILGKKNVCQVQSSYSAPSVHRTRSTAAIYQSISKLKVQI